MAPVIYWLYFTFVKKSFLDNFIKGQSLFVDLLFGLPIVLLFAIIIYAMIYWTLKVVAILLAPYLLEENKYDDLVEDVLDPAIAEEHGEDYWKETEEEISEKKALQAKETIDKDKK
jgi:hypothetical protein